MLYRFTGPAYDFGQRFSLFRPQIAPQIAYALLFRDCSPTSSTLISNSEIYTDEITILINNISYYILVESVMNTQRD